MRRVAALVSLAALLSPIGSGAAVTLHLAVSHASHHHDADDDAARDLQAVWHGHSHDKSTPEHDHPGITAQSPAARVSVAPLQSPSPQDLGDFVAYRLCAEQRLGRPVAAGCTGAGPPTSSERQTILRV